MKRLFAALIFIACFTGRAQAFDCYNGASKVYNGSGTFYVQIDPVVLDKSVADVVLSMMASYAKCGGSTGPRYKDALRINTLSLTHPTLAALGYTAYVIDPAAQKTAAPAANVCLWPDARCSTSSDNSGFERPLNATIGMQRPPGSGNWSAGTIIPAGSEIAVMETQTRYHSSWAGTINWIFSLKSPLTIPAYTCDVSHFDSTVTLPAVARSDLVSNGSGRYPGAKKDFSFTLACDQQTAVSVTFEGDTLTGTDDVLANKESGNQNVGVQLLFNHTTPVKYRNKFQALASAQTTETLAFSAWYYYNGGTVSGGPVKAQTTFQFEYH